MRKILLCTTALAGAGILFVGTAAAAEKPKLEMSGYLRFEAWSIDQDKTGTASAGTNQGVEFEMDDVEIHFDGTAKADNGLEYGFHVELQEGEADGQAGYDVASLFVRGGWGMVEMGSTPGVEDVFKVGAVSIMADMDGAWDGDLVYAAVDNAAYVGSNMAGNTGDSNKITYYSPVFSGFSAGVSFAPNSDAALNSGNQAETQTPVNVVELAAKYAGSLGGVDVEVSARGLRGDYGANGTDSAATELEDVESWGIGAMAAYQGFEVAGSYTDNGDTGVTKANKAAGHDAGGWWDLGVAYGTGPYKVSVAYMQSWAGQGTGVDDDTVDYLSVGGLYSAAPGLDFYATYQHVELEQAGTTSDNTANLFMVGTQVSF